MMTDLSTVLAAGSGGVKRLPFKYHFLLSSRHMNKRYQVFVSSTYADLKDERSSVIQTLMEMDCIPSGMELFPAMDEEQFEFIKKVIDDCDYYLLIVGGRYGSTTDEGISYTEKEYDYAVAKGLKVVAFLHGAPGEIPVNKTDKNEELAKRLSDFRLKAQTNRLVKYWSSTNELPGLVSLSLSKTIKTYPAVGWIRGDSPVSSRVLEEVNELRKVNAELLARVEAQSKSATLTFNGENIAGLDHEFKVKMTITRDKYNVEEIIEVPVTFKDLFSNIGPLLESNPNETKVMIRMRDYLEGRLGFSVVKIGIDNHDFQTIAIQFRVLKLITVVVSATTTGGQAMFWGLTATGVTTLLQLRAVRAS